MSRFSVPDGRLPVKRRERSVIPWTLQAELAQARGLTCAAVRRQVHDLAVVPLLLRADCWLWLTALALEATDRAEHGCHRCGALIERPDGQCRDGVL